MGKKYQYIGSYPQTTESGAPLAPGDMVEFEGSSDYYQTMIDEGTLVDPEAQAKAAEEAEAQSQAEEERASRKASSKSKEG